MTDEKVIKAISKADRLGEVLEIAKQNAAKKSACNKESN